MKLKRQHSAGPAWVRSLGQIQPGDVVDIPERMVVILLGRPGWEPYREPKPKFEPVSPKTDAELPSAPKAEGITVKGSTTKHEKGVGENAS